MKSSVLEVDPKRYGRLLSRKLPAVIRTEEENQRLIAELEQFDRLADELTPEERRAVARYLGKYGSKGVKKAVIISGVPPYLLKTEDNPEGVDASVFDGIQKAVAADRYAFFTGFFQNFYNTDQFLGKRISEQTIQASWNIAAGASATASLACVATWYEDFRQDLARIDVPTLVIQGDADRILPITASGLRTAKLIKGARLVVVKDGPHCITWTHAEEVNAELLSFLGQEAGKFQKEVA